jgi:hypothetical protein
MEALCSGGQHYAGSLFLFLLIIQSLKFLFMKEQHVIADQMAEIRLSYKPLRKPHTPIIKTSEESYRQAIKYFPKDTIALQEHFIVLFLQEEYRARLLI